LIQQEDIAPCIPVPSVKHEGMIAQHSQFTVTFHYKAKGKAKDGLLLPFANLRINDALFLFAARPALSTRRLSLSISRSSKFAVDRSEERDERLLQRNADPLLANVGSAD